jgi:ATP-binding cassette subfamily F protein 3
MEMRQALSFALQGFDGAMVLVSHDRYLLSSVCDDFYLVDAGAVNAFDGDLDDYRKWLFSSSTMGAAEPAQSKDSVSKITNKSPELDKKARKRLEAECRE